MSASSFIGTIVIRTLVWSLLLLFGIGLSFGVIAGVGAAIGAFLGVLCVGKTFTVWKTWTAPAVVILWVLILALLAVRGTLTGLLPLGLLGVGLANFLTGVLFGAFVVPFTMMANRLIGVNILEALFAGLVASIPFLDASGGHFERPRWFSDLVIERGEDPALLLSWTGGALILLSPQLYEFYLEINSKTRAREHHE